MTEYALTDADGTVRWRGTIDPPPGGGGGLLASADFLFTERATAGTLTATLALDAGSVVLDILGRPLAGPWASDEAGFNVHDADSSLFINTSVKAFVAYDPTAPDQDTNYLTLGYYGASFQSTAYLSFLGGPAGKAGIGVRYATATTLSLTISTAVGTPPIVPAGVLLVKVVYFTPATPVVATFA